MAGFPGVTGLKGQKGDFTVIDIKGEFYDKLFQKFYILYLINYNLDANYISLIQDIQSLRRWK